MNGVQKAAKLRRVKKRIVKLKEFYKHVAVYVIVHLVIIGRRMYLDISRGDTVIETLTSADNYRLFFWWSVLLVLHAFKIYRLDFLFGKNWEQRKIAEEMNKDTNL